ncbi:hypothetical protein Tco_0532913 [Tanacetum coccineum]
MAAAGKVNTTPLEDKVADGETFIMRLSRSWVISILIFYSVLANSKFMITPSIAKFIVLRIEYLLTFILVIKLQKRMMGQEAEPHIPSQSPFNDTGGNTNVDVRTYLLGGAIDSSEANGIIHDPKLELESSRFTFDLVPLSYESVDVVVLRRRIGFRMELVQGATPICEGSCRLTSLERQEVWNDCRSCKVRVGSNGNLLWEASVLLGRKKGGVHGDDVAKTVFRMRNGHVEVYGYAFWVNQCTSGFHGVNEPGGVRVAREDDRGVSEGREDVREVFQQRGSGAKRKLSRCGRNQMGNEPILALPEGADDFVVYYDARSKDLEACLEKGEGDCLYVATTEGSYEGLHG